MSTNKICIQIKYKSIDVPVWRVHENFDFAL